MQPEAFSDGTGAPRQAPPWRADRRLTAFAGLGVAAYVVVLISGFPAGVALRLAGEREMAAQASGTIWDGAFDLGPGGVANWRFAPLRSLGALALAADLTVRGPGTDLAGGAQWRPGWVALNRVEGTMGWPLVESLAPKLPFRCDLAFSADIRSLVLAGPRSGAVGELRGGPGACTGRAGSVQRSAAPALTITATMDAAGSQAWIAPQAQPSNHLADASVSRDGRLVGTVRSAGAAVLPPGAIPGEVSFETRL